MNGNEEQLEEVKPLRNADWTARVLGTTKGRVYELARQRIIPSVRLGRQVRFDEDAIRAFIDSGGRGFAEDTGAEVVALPSLKNPHSS